MDSFQDFIVMLVWLVVFAVVLFYLVRSLRIVPQRYAMIAERLGRYHATLHSGFHILLPFVDRVTYTLDLKEETIDVPPQECFTLDEIKVIVDGVMYISVQDPVKAAYGITSYKWAAMQLAQTTTRAVIGKINLDKTFEEREFISATVVNVLEQTSQEWGIRVHRYEIKNIQPPKSVQHAMEKQVRAERERKAILAKAEGDRQARINRSEGVMTEMINTAEGEKQKRINEAEGQAAEVRALADATAQSLEKIAVALSASGGDEAVRLQLVEQYLAAYRQLGASDTRVVVPLDVTDMASLLDRVGLGNPKIS